MLITVVLAFALCWFLMYLNVFLQDFSDVFPLPCGIPVGLQTTGFLFGHANSAINCCIYVIFSQDFRRGFKDIVRPLFPKRSGTLLLENSRGATMQTTPSTCKSRPQPKSFKTIEDSNVWKHVWRPIDGQRTGSNQVNHSNHIVFATSQKMKTSCSLFAISSYCLIMSFGIEVIGSTCIWLYLSHKN